LLGKIGCNFLVKNVFIVLRTFYGTNFYGLCYLILNQVAPFSVCGSIVDDHSDRMTGQATGTRQDTTKTQNKEDFSQENFDSPGIF